MKFSHNKKRNTAFIYETLLMEYSKASINEEEQKKNNILSILKEYFSKAKILKQDLEIYKAFEKTDDLDKELITRMIGEAKLQFNSLDREQIFETQTKLINTINKSLSPNVWTNFVPNYKKLATINQALNKTLNPKKQVIIEKKLVNMLSKIEQEKKPFPNVNNLALKTFVEKFNDQYGDKLNEQQKKLLSHYITSSDDDTDFKLYFYEEVSRLKQTIQEKINNSDNNLSSKLQLIYEKVDDYNKRKLDTDLMTEVLRIQSLIEEI